MKLPTSTTSKHVPARNSSGRHLTVRLLVGITLAATAVSMSGCLAAAAGAGAAGGYHAHKEGYRVQSPIKKQ